MLDQGAPMTGALNEAFKAGSTGCIALLASRGAGVSEVQGNRSTLDCLELVIALGCQHFQREVIATDLSVELPELQSQLVAKWMAIHPLAFKLNVAKQTAGVLRQIEKATDKAAIIEIAQASLWSNPLLAPAPTRVACATLVLAMQRTCLPRDEGKFVWQFGQLSAHLVWAIVDWLQLAVLPSELRLETCNTQMGMINRLNDLLNF